jgi:hypothetical protein
MKNYDFTGEKSTPPDFARRMASASFPKWTSDANFRDPPPSWPRPVGWATRQIRFTCYPHDIGART